MKLLLILFQTKLRRKARPKIPPFTFPCPNRYQSPSAANLRIISTGIIRVFKKLNYLIREFQNVFRSSESESSGNPDSWRLKLPSTFNENPNYVRRLSNTPFPLVSHKIFKAHFYRKWKRFQKLLKWKWAWGRETYVSREVQRLNFYTFSMYFWPFLDVF